jgi:hypothetical protein
MNFVRTMAALIAACILLAAPTLAEGEHEGYPPTATTWGPTDHGLAMALKVSATTIHVHDKLPATIQIVNRGGLYVHLARTVPSNDYVFAVTDQHGRLLPPSTNVPFDLAMNGITGQGFGIDPGLALFEDFPDITGYFGFTGPGVYDVVITTKVEFKEHPNGPYANLRSNTVTITVLP